MNLLKKLATPLLASSMTLTLSSLANSEESKGNVSTSIGKILSFADKVEKTILPLRIAAGKNEDKKGVYYAWDLTGDGLYNLIIFRDYYPGTVIDTGDFIKGMPNPSPYSILINIEDPEHYDTKRGDIYLRRSRNGKYEKAEYVESGKDV